MDPGGRSAGRAGVSGIPQDVWGEEAEIEKQNVDQRVFLFPQLLASDFGNGRVVKWLFAIV